MAMPSNPIEPTLYIPHSFTPPDPPLPNVPSAWRGIEMILPDLLARLDVPRGTFLEFGVDYGYSTAALARHARHIIGIDTFEDIHSGGRSPEEVQRETANLLGDVPNLALWRQPYHEFIQQWGQWNKTARTGPPVLIHIDIDHSYHTTMELGAWAVAHSPVTLFHDVLSYPNEVGRAVGEIAAEFGLHYYLYPECHGLGILSKREMKP